MTKYVVRLADTVAVAHVCEHMRDADRREIRAVYGDDVSPEAALRMCWLASRDATFTWTVDGVPGCLFGVREPGVLNNVAVPWLITTPTVREHAAAFLRGSVRIVRGWATEFSVMRNYVDQRNLEAVRWLRWLGFVIYYPEPYGPDELPFHPFEMRS